MSYITYSIQQQEMVQLLHLQKAFADEFSQKLKADGVDAVILTST